MTHHSRLALSPGELALIADPNNLTAYPLSMEPPNTAPAKKKYAERRTSMLIKSRTEEASKRQVTWLCSAKGIVVKPRKGKTAKKAQAQGSSRLPVPSQPPCTIRSFSK
jgi:hypothetical protein